MKKVLSSMLVSMLIVTGVSAAYENNIVDVTNGEEIRGMNTPADAGGFAKAGYHDGEYMLHVELSNLGDPVGDDFYEGWVVRKSPFAFISTGELEKKDDKYINHFTSSTDYTDYDFYVLTLEPNDGNPAPADHIVEGNVVEAKMMKKEMSSTKVFNITGENFSFSQDKIEVYEGDTVTINFESTGGFHDWGVDEFDAWTDQVSEGETTSITFVADKTGTFEYYCSVGNHRAQGMNGWLVVNERSDMVMKENHMMKDDMMKDGDKMMKKKVLTSKQKALRSVIKAKIQNADIADFDVIFERIENFKSQIDEKGYSEKRKERILEILDALSDVLAEKKMEMMINS